MKKNLIMFSCIFLISWTFPLTQNQQMLPGEAWNSVPTLTKHLFLKGYFEGQKSVIKTVGVAMSTINLEIDKAKTEEDKEEFKNWKKGIQLVLESIKIDIVDIAPEDSAHEKQILEGVDEFYKDYANKHIFVLHAIRIAALRISGIEENLLKETILFYRKEDAKKQDKKGTFSYNRGNEQEFITEEWRLLKGIDKLSIIIEYLDEDAIKIGLTEGRLRTVTELRLRKEGIKITEGSSTPWLYVNINVIRGAYNIDLKIFDSVIIPRLQNVSIYASIWSTGIVGTYSDHLEYIISSLSAGLDKFLNDWYKANPKK